MSAATERQLLAELQLERIARGLGRQTETLLLLEGLRGAHDAGRGRTLTTRELGLLLGLVDGLRDEAAGGARRSLEGHISAQNELKAV